MLFLNPSAWWLALLAIPIVVLYILKIRLREQPVSTSIFWEQVFEERRTRSFWQQLRHILSLLLSLIFLTLLAGAVLHPVLSSRDRVDRTVIVFDHSASMNAVDGGASRFDQAKSILGKLLAYGDERNSIALISAAGEPRVVLGFSNHPGTLRKAAETIKPTDLPTRLDQAIELARTISQSDESKARILVITDGCTESVKPLLEAEDLTFFPVGKSLDNAAITRFQPRRLLADPLGYEVLIELTNRSDEPKECRLELSLNDQIVDLRPLTLAPNSVETQVLHSSTDQGGLLKASLDVADALAADNVAWAVLPAKPLQKIELQGENDFFLARVLQSQQNVELTLGDGVSQTGETVHIFHQTVPSQLPDGNVMIIDPRNDCELFTVGEPIESPLVGTTDKDSPLMRFVHLNNVLVPGARDIQFAEGIEKPKILAETPEGNPIFFQWEKGVHGNGKGKVVVLSAELKRGDLALRTAFPIMVSHILASFRDGGGELERTYRTGEPVSLAVSESDSETIRLRGPDGSETVFPVKDGTVSLGELSQAGIWKLGDSDKPIACNLGDVAESDLRTAPEGFYDLREGALQQSASIPPIWFLLAVSALCLTLFDWFLYQRRWID